MESIERVKTGIPGFDELIEGGFPKGFNILITGGPGTGKTIFGLQYLYNGAMSGENGVYVSLETSVDGIKKQAMQFGWDLGKLEKEGKIIILRIPMDVIKLDLFISINDAVKKIGAKRLVFDSLDSLAINIDMFKVPVAYVGSKNRLTYTGKSRRRITYLVMNELSKLKTTNLVIAAASEGQTQITVDGVSEYASDGVILLSVKEIAKVAVRSVKIQKMRNSKQELDDYTLEISPNGLLVKKEKIYSGSKISGINP